MERPASSSRRRTPRRSLRRSSRSRPTTSGCGGLERLHARERSPTSPPAPQPTASRPSTAVCSRCTSRPATGLAPMSGHAVVSCHVESPLDDRVWDAFESLLRRRPGGFVVTPLLRPPHAASGENDELWLERARRVQALAPLGHHTHWGGPSQARPQGEVDAAAVVREEAAWFREHDLEPGFFCGGGWYLDLGLAETLASFGYVDCTATTFRQQYLQEGSPRLQLPEPSRLRLPSGASLLELPATHSLGMLARGVPSPARARPSALPRLGARATESEPSHWKGCCACSASAAGRSGSTSSPSGLPRPRNWPGRRLRSARDDDGGCPRDQAVPVLTVAAEDVRQAPREHARAVHDRRRRPHARPVRGARASLARLRPEADPLGLALGSRARLDRLSDPAARARLLARRALRATRDAGRRAARIVPSVALVAGLALAFAVGTGQHFTTFGLYVVGAVFVSVLITVFRGSYEMVTASLLRAAGVRRKVVLVGDDEARAHLRAIARREPGRHHLRLRRRGRARVRRSRTRSTSSRSTN